jgi:hypothetical protein
MRHGFTNELYSLKRRKEEELTAENTEKRHAERRREEVARKERARESQRENHEGR